ncbi:MAG: hypothetical protein AB1730_06530 [Myxococcota bacterium]|jgi:hypothetical protein
MADQPTQSQPTADDELSKTLLILIGAGAVAFVGAVFLFVM